MEKEGVFRAHSILMGVRYVFGANFQEVRERGIVKDEENANERMEEAEHSAEASKRLLEEEVEEMMMSD